MHVIDSDLLWPTAFAVIGFVFAAFVAPAIARLVGTVAERRQVENAKSKLALQLAQDTAAETATRKKAQLARETAEDSLAAARAIADKQELQALRDATWNTRVEAEQSVTVGLAAARIAAGVPNPHVETYVEQYLTYVTGVYGQGTSTLRFDHWMAVLHPKR